MAELTTTTLPVLPLNSGVVFPQMVVTVGIESDRAVHAIAAAENTGGKLLLVPQIDGEYASVGTIAEIQEMVDGTAKTALIAGVSRAQIGAGQPESNGVLWVEVHPIDEPVTHEDVVMDLAREFRAVVTEIMDHRGIAGVAERILAVEDPGQLVDLCGLLPRPEPRTEGRAARDDRRSRAAGKGLSWMREVLAGITLRKRVRDDATENIEKNQRDYLLRQQMDSIRRQLGEESGSVAAEYREHLQEATMPEAVAESVEREIDRLERQSEQSPEHSWIRTWLDTVFDLPWGESTDDNLDLGAAREVLDTDHTGLEDVKERIIEHLAVRKLRVERGLEAAGEDRRAGGAILLLVGPPGVGKTSLGESVARALGREFVRVSLGGIRDEAESPRASPYLRRCPTGSHRSGPHRSRIDESGVPSR